MAGQLNGQSLVWGSVGSRSLREVTEGWVICREDQLDMIKFGEYAV